jgi:phage replication O-like protein O
MANPQPDKFTALSNEILEALCRNRIPGEVRQIVDVVIRQTYGWQRKIDVITLERFAAMTGLKKPSIIRSIRKAMEHSLIYKSANGEYGFQKDFTKWKPFTKVLTEKAVYKSANKSLQKCKQKFTKVLTITDEPKERKERKETPLPPQGDCPPVSFEPTAMEMEFDPGEIILYLNKKAGRKFDPKTKPYRKVILDRYKDGYTADMMKAAIDQKVWDWQERWRDKITGKLDFPEDRSEMSEYLCPDTLFRPSKFPKYYEQAARAQATRQVKPIIRRQMEDQGMKSDAINDKINDVAWQEWDCRKAAAIKKHGKHSYLLHTNDPDIIAEAAKMMQQRGIGAS